MRKSSSKARPAGLTILAIWYFCLSIYDILGVTGIVIDSDGLLGFLNSYVSSFELGMLSEFVRILAGLLYGIAAGIVGFGLWMMKKWGWGAGLVMGILLLPGIPVGTLIGVATIIYLLRSQGAKEAFGEDG